MKYLEGKLNAKGVKLAVVLSKFNSFVGERLLDGAKDAFYQLGGIEDDLTIVKVPGAYETPGTARRLMESDKYDAVVCLGVIIRGGTPHFDFVAGNSSKAIMELSYSGKIPVIYGIVTTDDIEQALDRAGIKSGNKGYDSVMAAIEMTNLYKEI